jgi:hypothetical protein
VVATAPATPTTPAPVAPAVQPSSEPPTTPPPVANEALPPREPGSGRTPGQGEEGAGSGAAGDRPVARANRPGGPRRGGPGARNPGGLPPLDRGTASPPPAVATRPPPEAPRKPKDDIEALLEAASGNRRAAAPPPTPSRRDEEEPVAARAEKAPTLERDDIVKGMTAVMPRARECYNQYKVPGVATVKITVSPAGRVTSAAVTGRFAGTPSGTCVENALKTARFPASAGRTFDYVVPLR